MHRLAAIPGGWTPDLAGVVFVEQTIAPIVILTAKDTEIQTLAGAIDQLPSSFAAVRAANLLNLQQELAIDTYAETVLGQARLVILRLLGGRGYWSYGLEVVRDLAADRSIHLAVLPGDDRPDLDLMSHSTLPLALVDRFWRYFNEGGVDNARHALMLASDLALDTQYRPPGPIALPRVGCWCWRWANLERRWQANSRSSGGSGSIDLAANELGPVPIVGKVGILFYRAHVQAGNLAPIADLAAALAARGLEPIAIYVSALQDPEVQQEAIDRLRGIDCLIVTTGFAVANLARDEAEAVLWQALDVPVIQAIFSSTTPDQWAANPAGLSARDVAMNVALPEVDGRIIGRAVAFKTVRSRDPRLETDVITLEPVADRIAFVADLAAAWVRLRRSPPADRRLALVLANYPNRDGRLANGVGLDTPASVVEILRSLQAAGYDLGDPANLPQTGAELIDRLTQGITNDPEAWQLRPVVQAMPIAAYDRWFQTLDPVVQSGVIDRWGSVQAWVQDRVQEVGHRPVVGGGQGDCAPTTGEQPIADLPIAGLPIAGCQLGNVFIGIQPARGYDRDPSLNYHAPDLAPTHDYLAFYAWLRSQFRAQAIVHVGKHGTLEWLPGKSVALSSACYPEAAIGPLPHLYPFIVNDPGEGCQAKRRAQAVVIDHLTPPLTRAELYGQLSVLEGWVDEYYEAQSLDPKRTGAIAERIVELVKTEQLSRELASHRRRGERLSPPENSQPNDRPQNQQNGAIDDLITRLDGYLCDLKESQIRDGLHIFGQSPQGDRLRDLAIAIARSPSGGRVGLTRAIGQDLGLALDPLSDDPATVLSPADRDRFLAIGGPTVWTWADAIAALESIAAGWVDRYTQPERSSANGSESLGQEQATNLEPGPITQSELAWLADRLLPQLQICGDRELGNLLHGLAGRFVPAGPAGAPTRGRPEVLPTGRNFYAVDLRALPTETAWDVGRRAAELVVDRYCQENGDYPQTLALSVWGTATMRTGGDDIAEALALIGARPVWDGVTRRVTGVEIIPIAALGRPRVDVTLRISGFFRDAFPNLIDLFDRAVWAIAALAEPADENPIAARVRQETAHWQALGLDPATARDRSHYRIFGSRPGAYGAGLQGLIESQAWTTDEDLARAYVNWSSYAYTTRAATPTDESADRPNPTNPTTPADRPPVAGIPAGANPLTVNLAAIATGHSAPEAFTTRLKDLQIVLHNQDNREHDLLDSDDYYQFQGGLTAAIRVAQGQEPTVYFGDHAQPESLKIRDLAGEIARVYRSRVVNPKWISGALRHGYKGAFEMAATIDFLFGYDATAHCVPDFMYKGVAQAYLLDRAVQAAIQTANPWALRDMAERLLEAGQRGLWATLEPALKDQLRAIAHAAEADIEGRSAP